VVSTVVGARSPTELADILRWRTETVPAGLWTALKKDGFILADAPVPGSET
jgi:D-threo-aldose 1-dehydrogenase